MSDATIKIAFVDFATVKFEGIAKSLASRGTVEMFAETPKFLDAVKADNFDVCIVNLLIADKGPFDFIRSVRGSSKNENLRIIVISKQVQRVNIQKSIEAGANDFVADPFEPENLLNRILYHLAPKQVINLDGFEAVASSPDTWPYVNILIEATEVLSHTRRNHEHKAFFSILGKVAASLESNRTSLVIVDGEGQTGVVLSSSDDPSFVDFPISLHKYPEILHVMNTAKFVLIEDVNQNAMTSKINDSVKSITIGSLMVFPIRFQDELAGVMTVRRPKARELPSLPVLRVLQTITNSMAAHANMKSLLRRIYKDYQPAKAA